MVSLQLFIIKGKQLLTFRPFALCVLLLLLFFSQLIPVAVLSKENLSASTAFKAGQQCFQTGEYEQALAFFKKAQAAGLDKPALFYNIGVCSYKLGRYENAIEAFRRTATFPKMASLAYYNLAVIAEKQEDADAAIAWLKKSLATAGQGEEDKRLSLLAQTALSRIQKKQGGARTWTRYAALGVGFEDNVSMVESDDLNLISEEGDFFRDVFGFIRSPLLYGDSATGGLFFRGDLLLHDYADLNEYDTGTLRVEGWYQGNVGGLQLEGGTGYSYMLWDHSGYSQSPSFALQAGHPLGEKFFGLLRYEAKYYDMLNADYDYLRGWRHRVTTEFSTGSDRYRFKLGYTLEENDRAEQDYAPRRHLIQAALEMHSADQINIHFSVSYRDTTYEISGDNDIDEARYEVSLFFSYGLSQNLELSGRACHTDYDSNSSLYDFSINMASISIGYSF